VSLVSLHHVIQDIPKKQRWASALFSRFRAREREAKKERESAKEKEREKKRKRRARKKKSANSRFFLNPKWKSGFRAQSRSAGGKAKALSEMYSSVQNLHELNKSLKNMIFMRKLKNISLLNSLEALGIVPTTDAVDVDEGRVIAMWGADPIHPTSAAYRELAAKVASKATDLLNLQSNEDPCGGERKRKPEQRDPWIAGSQSVAKRLDNKSSLAGTRGHGGYRGHRGPPSTPTSGRQWKMVS
jgi:hypothetical protein